MHASYDYYIGVYMGDAIASCDWARLERRAADYLDYITLGRAKSYTADNSVKDCVCALAEQIQAKQVAERAIREVTQRAATTQEKSSVSVGNYSESYRSSDSITSQLRSLTQEADKRCLDICQRYLLHTGLLYRGIGMVR